MQVRRLKWLAIVAPLVFLGALDYVRHGLLPALLHSGPGYALVGAVVAVGVAVFANSVFGLVERMQRDIVKRSAQLALLNRLSQRVASSLDLPTVLQKVVDAACELTDARYGALALFDASGRIHQFLTHGVRAQERERIGDPPQGLGLLGWLHQLQEPLRLADLSSHPRFVGFPPNHPFMKTFIGVPIRQGDEALGNLYLTEKLAGKEFTQEDENLLVLFAAQAATAMHNARLHQQVGDVAIMEERERIAREMHDGIAQVLGYVNTKTQAVKELLQAGRNETAINHLLELENAARDLYADVREGILALRTASSGEGDWLSALQEYLHAFTRQSDIKIDLEVEEPFDVLQLAPAVEIQLLRIIQEALTNVRKHARTRQASVRFRRVGDRLQVTVEDQGQGFNPLTIARGQWPKFGLQTMQERAEAIGALFQLESSPGRGTRVSLRLPLPSVEEAASVR